MNKGQTKEHNNASNIDLKLKIKAVLKGAGNLIDNALGSVIVLATTLIV